MDKREACNFDEFCIEMRKLIAEESIVIDNEKTVDFINGMMAWLEDTKGGQRFFEQSGSQAITWTDLITLIRASALYQ